MLTLSTCAESWVSYFTFDDKKAIKSIITTTQTHLMEASGVTQDLFEDLSTSEGESDEFEFESPFSQPLTCLDIVVEDSCSNQRTSHVHEGKETRTSLDGEIIALLSFVSNRPLRKDRKCRSPMTIDENSPPPVRFVRKNRQACSTVLTN